MRRLRLDFSVWSLCFQGPLGWLQHCVSGVGSSRKMGFGTRRFSLYCMSPFMGSSHLHLDSSPNPHSHYFLALPLSGQSMRKGQGRSCSGFPSCSKAGWTEGRGKCWHFRLRFQVASRWCCVPLCAEVKLASGPELSVGETQRRDSQGDQHQGQGLL